MLNLHSVELNSNQLVIIIGFFVSAMAQIYIQPFDSMYRFSLAVIALHVLLVMLDELPALLTSISVGLLSIIFRTLLAALSGRLVLAAFVSYLPIGIFYLSYGMMFSLLKVRSMRHVPLYLLTSLCVCDVLSNLAEFAIRLAWRTVNLEYAMMAIIIIALFRSLLATSLIILTQHYLSRLHERRLRDDFVDQIIATASLKTELFFLKKSRLDIERTMTDSYDIYRQIEDEHLRAKLLNVTKNIHEIKKDYGRVVAGLERQTAGKTRIAMTLEEIFDIVIEANQNVALTQRKQIQFTKSGRLQLRMDNFYSLISIINNLVSNAVDAIGQSGKISLSANYTTNSLEIAVGDDGKGITADQLSLIFKPGFSTKFNEQNGQISGGVGLTHVKHIVEQLYQGSIAVQSSPKRRTTFTISLPMARVKERIE